MPKKLSRLGIFVFFDPQGIVDRYVSHLLLSLRPNFEKIVVISNGQLEQQQADKLQSVCDEVFFRENKGLDAAAFKQGFVSFCGWEQVEKYDEVVLMNDTFFGPIHSFDDMFDEMACKELDFWGISAGYRQQDGWKWTELGYIPEHIQTFFVAFRKQMVCSKVFRDYWENYDDSLSAFRDVVSRHEMVMTKYFQDHGFRWDIYADTKRYQSPYKEENFNLYFYHANEMLQNMRFPILKRKVLSADISDVMYLCDLGDARAALEYITRNSEYDSNLIWDNILRLHNIRDLYDTLHLNYVLPSSSVQVPTINQAALVFYVTNPKFAKLFCEKAATLAAVFPVYLIPEGQEVQQLVHQYLSSGSSLTILEASGQQTEMGAFVLCCETLANQYHYLGFVHDLQNPNHYPASAIESTVQGYLQNMACDSGYVTQILHCFEANPRLGILGTPFPLHHRGFGSYGNLWGTWFNPVKDAADRWNLKCNLTPEKQPIMNQGVFWCRTASIRPVWQQHWCTGDFKVNPISLENKTNEVLKRILPCVAQSEGYYSGIVMTANYASVRISEQEYMLHEIIDTTKKQLNIQSESYIGYSQQLRACGSSASGEGRMIDLSQIGLRTLLLMVADKYLPSKISGSLLTFYQFCKRTFKRK